MTATEYQSPSSSSTAMTTTGATIASDVKRAGLE
jgi:hypothetical protein